MNSGARFILSLCTVPSSPTQLLGQPTAALLGTGARDETCTFSVGSLQVAFHRKAEPAAAGWYSGEPVPETL